MVSVRGWRRRRRLSRYGDDATEGLVWLVARGCIGFIDFTALGAVAVYLNGKSDRCPWALAFLPFFAASFVVGATQIRALLRVASLKLHNPAVHYGAASAQNTRGDTIEEDALPLIRRGIVAIVLSIPTLLVVVAAQIFACLATGYWTSDQRRRSTVAAKRASVCLLSLQTCALCASLVLKGRSVSELPAKRLSSDFLYGREGSGRLSGRLSAAFHALLWIWLVLVVSVLDDAAVTTTTTSTDEVIIVVGQQRRLARAFTPLWTAWVLLVASLALVLNRHRTNTYRLERSQIVGITAYVASCCFFACAVMRWLGFPFVEQSSLALASAIFGRTGGLLGLLGALCACLGLHLAFLRHARQLVLSRGHGTPMPLARTPDGYWGVSGAGESFWFILGSFERVTTTTAESPSLLSLTNVKSCCQSRDVDHGTRADDEEAGKSSKQPASGRFSTVSWKQQEQNDECLPPPRGKGGSRRGLSLAPAVNPIAISASSLHSGGGGEDTKHPDLDGASGESAPLCSTSAPDRLR